MGLGKGDESELSLSLFFQFIEILLTYDMQV